MSFWKIKNVSNTESELILYGDIVDSKPWWSNESDQFIIPKEFLNDLEKIKNNKKVTIRINSGGGDIFVALAIYTQLKTLDVYKTVIIDGICASAATIITMAGDIVKIPSSALMMIHNPKWLLFNYYEEEDLEKAKNVLSKCKQSIIETYKTKTNLSEEKISEMMDNETWFLGKEAVENGFADEVLFDEDINISNNGKFTIVNSISVDTKSFKNVPKQLINENLTARNSVKDKEKEPLNDDKGSFLNQKISEKGEKVMNLEELKAKYPELVNDIKNEGIQEERKRLKEIDEIANIVNSDLLNKARYDDPMDAKTLAFENMKLQNKQGEKFLNDIKDDFDESGVENIPNEPSSPVNDEKKAKKEARKERVKNFMNKDSRRKEQ